MSVIEKYISESPQYTQDKLNEIYSIIKEVITDDISEKISWEIPTFFLNTNLVHFAYGKHHIGFYPGESGVRCFFDKLTDYKTSKGAIQFPYSKPLPKELIQEIVLFRIEENRKVKK